MGIINQTIVAEVARELGLEDKALMATASLGSSTPRLKKVRSVHHAAARLLATGMKASEVSLNTGLCPSRISILQNDPAFRDLVEFYNNAEVERFATVQDRMVMLGLTAAEELQDRIENEAEDMSTKDLVEVLTRTLDRGGYSPVTKSESKNLHAHVSLDDLQKIKQGVSNEQSGRVFTRTAAKAVSANPEPKAGNANFAGAVPETEETEGITIEGLGL